MKKLEGKVAIVTGGASGIGLGTVLRLVEDGAAVVVADVNYEAAQQVVKDITNDGGQAIAVKVDVSVEAEVKAMIDTTVQTFGKLDILHNNAAWGPIDDKEVPDMDVEMWDRVMGINLRGPMLGCKYAIPEMIKIGGGTIINTASANGKVGDYERTAYSASKAGLMSLTRSIATQHGKDNIRCNSILPGLILTPATKRKFSKELMELMEEGNLLPSIGEPEDIAGLVSFLVSNEGRYITGQEINCDGGVLVRAGAGAIMKYVRDRQN
ncbi:SDR family NAD(P)-dependent oxidoreductase [Paenibacillus pini]|uniref:3-oxoacyl-[acyl-carrier protein] reductase n=1 Tax=Paenibacillus pini JCM 16418 TaxID=1236976 RepID=W7YIF0_9BACL|nr:SDR family NAD(P)-dependent oxidoreductase [Paenibacillus pini]GAF07398.1 3-oxoacyl-[acyl-carrier protein] reductase [Paenibacillus pini JCM 16418]